MLRSRPLRTSPLLAAAALSLCLLLAGCGEIIIFTQLGETEANEMMAVLIQRDIACLKEAGKEDTWTLKVPGTDFARAVELLKSQGYPRQKFAKMGEIFQKSGLVSSPTEERIRYMYALSQEISDTLTHIDGVINARVHIVIPDNDPLADKIVPSSCAVFIKYRVGFDLESLAPQLKNLVMRSIMGLHYEDVTLVMLPAVAVAVPPAIRNESGARPDPKKTAALVAGAVAVLGVIGWWLRRRAQPHASAKPGPA